MAVVGRNAFNQISYSFVVVSEWRWQKTLPLLALKISSTKFNIIAFYCEAIHIMYYIQLHCASGFLFATTYFCLALSKPTTTLEYLKQKLFCIFRKRAWANKHKKVKKHKSKIKPKHENTKNDFKSHIEWSKNASLFVSSFRGYKRNYLWTLLDVLTEFFVT